MIRGRLKKKEREENGKGKRGFVSESEFTVCEIESNNFLSCDSSL